MPAWTKASRDPVSTKASRATAHGVAKLASFGAAARQILEDGARDRGEAVVGFGRMEALIQGQFASFEGARAEVTDLGDELDQALGDPDGARCGEGVHELGRGLRFGICGRREPPHHRCGDPGIAPQERALEQIEGARKSVAGSDGDARDERRRSTPPFGG